MFPLHSLICRLVCLYLLVTMSLFSVLSGQEKTTKKKSAFESYLVNEYQKTLDRQYTELVSLQHEKTKLVQDYDSSVYQISQIKQGKEQGFFDRVKLKNLLKESEDLSRRIIQVDRQIMSRQESIRNVIDKMIPLMEIDIMETIKALEKLSGEDRSAISNRLQAMISEKMEYQSYLAEPLRAQLKDVRYQRSDDPELLMHKSDFLLDQADKLQRYVALLDEHIDRMENEEEIRKQASRFIDDVYSFDKDREMKVGSRKTDKEISNNPPLSARIGRNDETDLPVFNAPGFRSEIGTAPYHLLLTSTLEISSLRINIYDDMPTIIRKLKHEKSLALYRMHALRKTAEEIRHLAEIKLRYSR